MQFIINLLGSIFSYIKSIFDSIYDFFVAITTFFLNLEAKAFDFFVDMITYEPKFLYSLTVDFAEYIFVSCGTCGVNYIYQTILTGVKSLKSFGSGSGSGSGFDFMSCYGFLADILSLNAGVQLLVCAYLLRFAIRRIPFIG